MKFIRPELKRHNVGAPVCMGFLGSDHRHHPLSICARVRGTLGRVHTRWSSPGGPARRVAFCTRGFRGGARSLPGGRPHARRIDLSGVGRRFPYADLAGGRLLRAWLDRQCGDTKPTRATHLATRRRRSADHRPHGCLELTQCLITLFEVASSRAVKRS